MEKYLAIGSYKEIGRIENLRIMITPDGKTFIFDNTNKSIIVKPGYYRVEQHPIIPTILSCIGQEISWDYNIIHDSDGIKLKKRSIDFHHYYHRRKITKTICGDYIEDWYDEIFHRVKSTYQRNGDILYDKAKKEICEREPENQAIYFRFTKILNGEEYRKGYYYIKNGRQYAVYRTFVLKDEEFLFQFECDEVLYFISISYNEDSSEISKAEEFSEAICIVKENGEVYLRKFVLEDGKCKVKSNVPLSCQSIHLLDEYTFLLKGSEGTGLCELNNSGEIITFVPPVNKYVHSCHQMFPRLYYLIDQQGNMKFRMNGDKKLFTVKSRNYYMDRAYINYTRVIIVHLENGSQISIKGKNKCKLEITVQTQSSVAEYIIEQDETGNIHILLNEEEVNEIKIPEDETPELPPKPEYKVRRLTPGKTYVRKNPNQ